MKPFQFPNHSNDCINLQKLNSNFSSQTGKLRTKDVLRCSPELNKVKSQTTTHALPLYIPFQPPFCPRASESSMNPPWSEVKYIKVLSDRFSLSMAFTIRPVWERNRHTVHLN